MIRENKYGVYLYKSAGNSIFHNNFLDNTRNAYEYASNPPGNSWDNGIEGNYWDDYAGVDANNDGIGDTPYAFRYCNEDSHPLMELWED